MFLQAYQKIFYCIPVYCYTSERVCYARIVTRDHAPGVYRQMVVMVVVVAGMVANGGRVE